MLRCRRLPRPFAPAALLALSFAAGACAPSRADRERDATRAVKDQIAADLTALAQAAHDLQAAAPAPDADGWNATQDAAAVAQMRAAWHRARAAYEHVEGAIAVLFPTIDVSIDARYDAFIATAPDDNLFDGQGVTGMHAVERILWADQIPARVVQFESALPGYRAAAFPANAREAQDFRDALLARLVADADQMEREFRPLALDPASAFRGVIGSLQEQREKVDLAATAEEESRYAQDTLADMRANLEGSRRTFTAFRPWLEGEGRVTLAADIDARLGAIQARYDALPGDALPEVPAGWNPDAPTAEQLATPYGTLREALATETDRTRQDSLVGMMNQAASAMGIPELSR